MLFVRTLILPFLVSTGLSQARRLHRLPTTNGFRRGARPQTRKIGANRKLGPEDACLTEEGKWELFTPFGCDDVSEITAAEFVEELNEILDEEDCDHGAMEELKLVFDGASASEVVNQIKANCEVKSGLSTDNPFPFTMIDDDNNNFVWLKSFFDGGSPWNDERQTVNQDGETVYELEDYPGSVIATVFEEIAMRRVMTFPTEISNFEDCEIRAAMCCWVQDRQADDDNGNCEKPYNEECVDADPADNTDICLVEMGRAPASSRVAGGYAIFEDEEEGDAHCHGFAWSKDVEDPSNLYKGNALFYVSMYDHLHQRGYVKNVPGAPMCGCVEQVRLNSIITFSGPINQERRMFSHEFLYWYCLATTQTDASRFEVRLYSD
jgi:hypothetical protein